LSTQNEVRRCCKVVNKYGLHTRTASAIVELLEPFDCEMIISSEKGESDAKDMIRLMFICIAL
jgi:phosphotransferase system HPr (HPr) family protein